MACGCLLRMALFVLIWATSTEHEKKKCLQDRRPEGAAEYLLRGQGHMTLERGLGQSFGPWVLPRTEAELWVHVVEMWAAVDQRDEVVSIDDVEKAARPPPLMAGQCS